LSDKEKVRKFILKNYSIVAKSAAKKTSSGCCGGGCSCGGNDYDIEGLSSKIGYSDNDLSSVPTESNMGLGCGNPLAIASLKEGEVVLDLGCGGGFDCFLARNHVKDTGYVIGVDMTPDMISLARKNASISGFNNIDFRLGEIENLPVEDSSVDVIISNCVINLSLNKYRVFQEAFRVLKKNGRIAFSDIVATQELPVEIKNDIALVASCIAGAEHIDNIKTMLEQSGFKHIELTPKDNSREIISTWYPGTNLENYVASYIIEAIKE